VNNWTADIKQNHTSMVRILCGQ